MKIFFKYFISISSVILGLLFLVAIITPMIAYQNNYTPENNLSDFIIYIFPNIFIFISGIYILFQLKNGKKIQKILIFVIIVILLFDIATIIVGLYCPPHVHDESVQKLFALNFWSSDFFQYLYHDYLSDICPILPSLEL